MSTMLKRLQLFKFLKRNQIHKIPIANLSGAADFKHLFMEEKRYTLEDMPFKDPYNIFKIWLQEAKEHPDIINPFIVCLATATKNGVPSARYMLCDSFNEHSFKFFTHHTTRKGQELKQNPLASMCFFWAPFVRTVRIEGHVEQLSDAVCDDLFEKRSYESQINLHSSSQTERIKNCNVWKERETEKKKLFQSTPINRPHNLSWYALVPTTVEFWQLKQRKERLRFRKLAPLEKLDEFTYEGEKGWVYECLEP